MFIPIEHANLRYITWALTRIGIATKGRGPWPRGPTPCRILQVEGSCKGAPTVGDAIA